MNAMSVSSVRTGNKVCGKVWLGVQRVEAMGVGSVSDMVGVLGVV